MKVYILIVASLLQNCLYQENRLCGRPITGLNALEEKKCLFLVRNLVKIPKSS
jgi:hypothetical protein